MEMFLTGFWVPVLVSVKCVIIPIFMTAALFTKVMELGEYGMGAVAIFFAYMLVNAGLLGIKGYVGIVVNIIWTIVEIVIFLYILKMGPIDKYHEDKAIMAARLGISSSDPRLIRVVNEIQRYAWKNIDSVELLDKLLKKSDKFTEEDNKPYNIELDDKIFN